MASGMTGKGSLILFICMLALASCQKDYSVEDPGKGTAGTWAFTEGTNHYQGTIDTAYIEIATGVKILHLKGKSYSATENFNLNLYTSDSFKVATYKASQGGVSFSYTNTFLTIYTANGIAGEFTATIDNLVGNRYITGQFSGTATDASGNIKNITLGGYSTFIDLSNNGSGVSNGTLGAAAGLCTPVFLAGTYANGVAMNSANTAEIQVTVTAPGTYNITSNAVNGVTFSGSGTFTSIGTQNVILTASGTPVAAGSQTYSIGYGSSTCSFNVIYN